MSAKQRRPAEPTAEVTTLSALNTVVHVRYDSYGVPHIDADGLHDLFTAQGYVTACDWLWQMDYGRRQASGRVS